MGLTRNRRRRNETVGECFGHRARLRLALAREIDLVLGNQLNRVPHPMELDDIALAHQTAIDELLTQTAAQIPREKERMVELVGRNFDPRLVVLVIDMEQPRRLLRVLDDVGEGFLRLCCGGGCGSRGCRSGWRSRHRHCPGGAACGRRCGVLGNRLRGRGSDRCGFGAFVGGQRGATGHRKGGRHRNCDGETGDAKSLHAQLLKNQPAGRRDRGLASL